MKILTLILSIPKLGLFFQIKLNFSSFSTLFHLFIPLFCLFFFYISQFHLRYTTYETRIRYLLYERQLKKAGIFSKNLHNTALFVLPQRTQSNSQS